MTGLLMVWYSPVVEGCPQFIRKRWETQNRGFADDLNVWDAAL